MSVFGYERSVGRSDTMSVWEGETWNEDGETPLGENGQAFFENDEQYDERVLFGPSGGWSMDNDIVAMDTDETTDLKGRFPASAVHSMWTETAQDDLLKWPEAWKRPEIPPPLDVYFDRRSAVYRNVEEDEGPLLPNIGVAFQKNDITYSMYKVITEETVYEPHPRDLEGVDPETYPPTSCIEEVVLRTEPEIRMFGTTMDGNTVCSRIRGFRPYFYVDIREDDRDTIGALSEEGRTEVERHVHLRMEHYMRMNDSAREKFRIASMHVETVQCLFTHMSSELKKWVNQFDLNADESTREENSVEELLALIYEVFRELEDTCRRKLSRASVGDRSSCACPHWTLINSKYRNLTKRVASIRPHAKERLFQEQEKCREKRIPKAEGTNDTTVLSFIPERYESRTYTKADERHFDGKMQATVERPHVRCVICSRLLENAEGLMESVYFALSTLENEEIQTDEQNTGDWSPVSHSVAIRDIGYYSRALTRISDCLVHGILQHFEDSLGESVIAEDIRRGVCRHVHAIQLQSHHCSLVGYSTDSTSMFKTILYNPRDCTALRSAIQHAGLLARVPYGKTWSGDSCTFGSFQTYESNIPFVLRFMIDTEIEGMGWVVHRPGTWEPVPVWDPDRKSKCQIEMFVADWDRGRSVGGKCVRQHGERWGQMAPFVYMWFDIEVAGQNPNRMPSAPNRADRVTQISCLFYRQYEKEPFESCILNLGGADPMLRRVNRHEEISDVERELYYWTRIFCFDTECDLLLAFRRLVEISCPDFIGGYNSVDFDMPYLIRRSINGVAVGQDAHTAFRRLSRVVEHIQERKDGSGVYWKGLSDIRRERFQSKAYGMRENDKVNTTGRVQFDALRILQRDIKERSYKLDRIAEKFLGLRKVPLPHYEITPKATSPYDVMRSLLCRYCMWDSMLPKKISIDNRTYDVIYAEMARISGVPMEYLLTKGQIVKATTQILKFNKRLREHEDGDERISYLMRYGRACALDINPSCHDVEDIKEGEDDDDSHMKRKADYSGATVIDPIRGLHKEPTPTLDFSSLYPSIMISLNMCFCTYVGTRADAEARGMTIAWDFSESRIPHDGEEPDGDCWVAPNGATFVRQHIREGVIPKILREVLTARSMQKKKMAMYDKGTIERSRHNGAQLGLKVTANSMYGFTAKILPELSEAVTSMGRHLLEYTRDRVYEIGQQNPRYNNTQLYGDTGTDGSCSRSRALTRLQIPSCLACKPFLGTRAIQTGTTCWKPLFAALSWPR